MVAAPLLIDGDPAPSTVVNDTGRANILLVCDHASNAVPASLDRLGLSDTELGYHIGWDIGAAAVTRHLARLLDAPAVLSGYSRLVIDCNRALDDPTLMPSVSDGIQVPANQAITGVERERRIEACFQPYHRAIEGCLDRFFQRDAAPAVISIHSFTPRMAGFERPWQIGVLWDDDPRMPLPLIANLSKSGDLQIGDNEPYSARDPHGFTMGHHATRHGLPHALLEIRQDEIGTDAGALAYAGILEAALRPIIDDQQLYYRRTRP